MTVSPGLGGIASACSGGGGPGVSYTSSKTITLCASAGNGPTDSISAAPSATLTTFTIFASPRFARPAEPRPTGADPADRGRACTLLVAGAPALVRLDLAQDVLAAPLLPADDVIHRRVEVGDRVAVGLDRHAHDGDRVLVG